MLRDILSVSGKPGLFKRISQAKNLMIAESLLDGKRIPLYPRDRVVSLGDISIFSTSDEDKPLYQIFTAIKAKEEGKQIAVDANDPSAVKAYILGIFPELNEERVYPTDLKKMVVWYNLLISKGLDDFEIEEKQEEGAEADSKEKPKDKVKEPAVRTPKAVAPKAAPKEVKKQATERKISRNKQG